MGAPHPELSDHRGRTGPGPEPDVRTLSPAHRRGCRGSHHRGVRRRTFYPQATTERSNRMTDELAMAAAAAVPIPETATAARTTTEPPVEPGDDGEDEEEDVKEKALAPLPVTYGTPASLQHLRDLEHGWDGDDAPAPSDTAI